MKRIFFYSILLIILSAQSFYAATNNAILLTDSRIKQYNEIAKEKFYDFYSNLSILCDNSITDYSKKKELTSSILDECADYTKLVKNDLQIIGLNSPNYSIADYLNNLSNANGNNNEKYISINATVSQDIKMYKKSGTSKYSFFVYYDREVIVGNIFTDESDKNAPKPVSDDKDMILEISTTDGKQFSIEQFGILNGNFDPLKNGYELVQPQQSAVQTINSQPHFIFNVQPATAKVFVDDMEIDYANGEKIPSTSGYHIIRVTADNYEEYKKQFNLSDTTTKLVAMTLQKSKGYFSIVPESDCAFGASMGLFKDKNELLSSLDENASKKEKRQAKKESKKPVFLGNIGVYNQPIETGTYRLLVRKNGFKKYENTITILKNETATQSVQLAPSQNAWVNTLANLACSFTLTTTSCGCCGSSGKCSMCNGTGKMSCYCCNGTGSIGDEQHNYKTCSTCNGNGNVTCKKCNGNGRCTVCNGRGHR